LITDTLQHYAFKFKTLRRRITRHGKVPHKPLLLLAIMDEVEAGNITSNKIQLTPELVVAFKENWALLVETPHSSDIMLTFFFFTEEKYWKLKSRTGTKMTQLPPDFKTFTKSLDYAQIDQELFELFLNVDNHNYLKDVLLDNHFPRTKETYLTRKKSGSGYMLDLEKKFLDGSRGDFISLLLDTDQEGSFFIRRGMFNKLVPKAYDYCCCITGIKAIPTDDFSMVKACHIRPISAHGTEEITNGLALSHNLQMAFDKGWITVTSDYKVLVSSSFAEDEQIDYNLKELHGRKIMLPVREDHYPDREHLTWHGEMVWKGG
jgi:putative restriction endonuclease